MAATVTRLLQLLGHERFAVVGHDRGAAVAYRTALDHEHAVSHLVVMDGLPLVEHLERTDAHFAQAWWHWWFLGQTDKPAERVICADPETWYRTPGPDEISAGNHEDLWNALRNPAVVHGMCEDYRAGLGIDRAHDEADRAAGRRITAPFLLLESAEEPGMGTRRIWCGWPEPCATQVINSGHHQAEQAPEKSRQRSSASWPPRARRILAGRTGRPRPRRGRPPAPTATTGYPDQPTSNSLPTSMMWPEPGPAPIRCVR